MKNLIRFSLIAALAIFPLAQAASIDTVTVTPNAAQVFTEARYPMQAEEFSKFKRVYTLSNGMTLAVYSVGPFMYAQINENGRERIVATSESTFSSTKSGLKMQINLSQDDAVSGEVYLPAGVTLAGSDSSQQGHTVYLR